MKTPRRVTFSSLFLFPIIASLFACGNQGKFDVTEVKDYKFYMDVQDPSLRDEFASVIDMFNLKSCAPIMSIVEDRSAANSFIRVTPNLEQRDGKVGWGRWTREATRNSNSALSNKRGLLLYEYGMDLEFDAKYFTSRLNSSDESKRQDLFKLFSHEAGHGLQMGHDSDVSSLMYPDISGDKDMVSFFRRVQNYLIGSEHPASPNYQCQAI